MLFFGSIARHGPELYMRSCRLGHSIARCCFKSLYSTRYHDLIGPSTDIFQINQNLSTVIQNEEYLNDGAIKETCNNQKVSTKRGLLCTPEILSAKDISFFAYKYHQLCKATVSSILKMNSNTESRLIVKQFDRLSEYLCRVLDLAEFIRNCHPDTEFRDQAEKTHRYMFEYLNTLNTNQQLYMILKEMVADEKRFSGLSPEEKAVAKYFLSDFEISGINLRDNKRSKFIELQNKIGSTSRDLVVNNGPDKSYLLILEDAAKSCTSLLHSMRVEKESNYFKLPTSGPVYCKLMCNLTDSNIRKQLYTANMRSSREQIQLLETLLKTKMALANLVGFPSFAHLNLSTKMAQTPDNVIEFLLNLSKENEIGLRQEKLVLSRFRSSNAKRFDAWDRYRLMSIQMYENKESIRTSQELEPYMTLGNIIQGIGRVFQKMYGIRLKTVLTDITEVWDESILRLDAFSENGERLGIIYLDLFARPSKVTSAAHFTIRCSRRVDDDVVLGLSNYNDIQLVDCQFKKVQEKIYQIPTIVITTDFAKGGPMLRRCKSINEMNMPINFSEVSTLFHEMGHAAHSILSQTDYQNLAGTRCVTDFVELPSVLMEEFCTHVDVVKEIFRHYKTDKALNISQTSLDQFFSARRSKIDHQEQISYSLLDQWLHSQEFKLANYDSTKIYNKTLDAVGPFPYLQETSWQAQFAHLDGYGATYYAYLFDKVIAKHVWTQLFHNDPLNRQSGEKLRQELLKWGGGKNPWECLAILLKDDELSAGGQIAMKRVGSWGIN